MAFCKFMCGCVCDMTHLCVWHDLLMRMTKLFHVRGMTPSFVQHDWFIYTCVTWLIHMWDVNAFIACHDSFIGVPWRMHMCDWTRRIAIDKSATTPRNDALIWYVWTDAPDCDRAWAPQECRALARPWYLYGVCVTRLIHICVTWLVHMSDITNS